MRSVLRVLGTVFVLVFGFCLLLGPIDWLAQTVWHLVAGWAYYLGRTAPQLRPNPAEFAVAGVALVVLTTGCHWLGRFLAPPLLGVSWRAKWTAQAVGLLVLLFVCGTAAVGITHQSGWMVRSPEPLVNSSGGMRVAVGRTVVSNNLKQLGLAAHNHADANPGLPAPTFTPDGLPLHSWHTFLLPYLEQDNIYRMMDRSKPWNDPVNRRAVEMRVTTFDNPFAPLPTTAGPQPTYLAPNMRLLDRPRRPNDTDLPLGLSNTILAGEALTDARPWADPLNWRDPRRPLGSTGGFAGARNLPVQMLMADGSVRRVTPAGWAAVMRGEPPGDD